MDSASGTNLTFVESREICDVASRGSTKEIPGTDKYKSDLMQLPSFESVSKCSLEPRRRRAPVVVLLHCIRSGGGGNMKDRARPLCIPGEKPRVGTITFPGETLYNVTSSTLRARDETTWTANFRRPRFLRCRTSKTMLLRPKRRWGALLHGSIRYVMRLELLRNFHTANFIARNIVPTNARARAQPCAKFEI